MENLLTLNSSPPEQNGHHFAGDIFKYIFVNEKFSIWINISLKFVPFQWIKSLRLWPVFCLLLGVSSDYAQQITGQVTEVTCPEIGWTQPELTLIKREKMSPGGWFNIKMSSYHYRKSHCGDKTIHLISTMGFAILIRWHLYIELGPGDICINKRKHHWPR